MWMCSATAEDSPWPHCLWGTLGLMLGEGRIWVLQQWDMSSRWLQGPTARWGWLVSAGGLRVDKAWGTQDKTLWPWQQWWVEVPP